MAPTVPRLLHRRSSTLDIPPSTDITTSTSNRNRRRSTTLETPTSLHRLSRPPQLPYLTLPPPTPTTTIAPSTTTPKWHCHACHTATALATPPHLTQHPNPLGTLRCPNSTCAHHACSACWVSGPGVVTVDLTSGTAKVVPPLSSRSNKPSASSAFIYGAICRFCGLSWSIKPTAPEDEPRGRRHIRIVPSLPSWPLSMPPVKKSASSLSPSKTAAPCPPDTADFLAVRCTCPRSEETQVSAENMCFRVESERVRVLQVGANVASTGELARRGHLGPEVRVGRVRHANPLGCHPLG